MIVKPHGMILVTGPTGSGKTTTLYGALQKINDPGKKIITIEDPVEYQLDGVNQIHVKPQIGLTFANGLRSIVRQDPDVIMVGEIRDAETAEIAVQAALTGHLVLSTLHTNDAAGAISRLLEMGVQDYLLSSSLLGVLAQRLVRRLCPALPQRSAVCRFKRPASRSWSCKTASSLQTIWEAVGCELAAAPVIWDASVFSSCCRRLRKSAKSSCSAPMPARSAISPCGRGCDCCETTVGTKCARGVTTLAEVVAGDERRRSLDQLRFTDL